MWSPELVKYWIVLVFIIGVYFWVGDPSFWYFTTQHLVAVLFLASLANWQHYHGKRIAARTSLVIATSLTLLVTTLISVFLLFDQCLLAQSLETTASYSNFAFALFGNLAIHCSIFCFSILTGLVYCATYFNPCIEKTDLMWPLFGPTPWSATGVSFSFLLVYLSVMNPCNQYALPSPSKARQVYQAATWAYFALLFVWSSFSAGPNMFVRYFNIIRKEFFSQLFDSLDFNINLQSKNNIYFLPQT